MGTGHACALGARHAVVVESPSTAIDQVHVFRSTCDHARGQAAAGNLAVGGHVGLDAEAALRALRADAETGDHLVEDQRDVLFDRQLAKRLEEFHWLLVRMARLHRLDQHGGDLAGALLDRVKRRHVAVVQHDDLVGEVLQDARRHREAVAGEVLGGRHRIREAVIAAVEKNDLLAAGRRARDAYREHHRLGARLREQRAFVTRDLAEQLAGPKNHVGIADQRDALVQAVLDRVDQEGCAVPEQVHAHIAGDVDVPVAVGVVDVGAFGLGVGDLEVELLQILDQVEGATLVDEVGLVFENIGLGLRHEAVVLLDESGDPGAVLVGEVALVERLEGPRRALAGVRRRDAVRTADDRQHLQLRLLVQRLEQAHGVLLVDLLRQDFLRYVFNGHLHGVIHLAVARIDIDIG